MAEFQSVKVTKGTIVHLCTTEKMLQNFLNAGYVPVVEKPAEEVPKRRRTKKTAE